jgi:hypothetical protein
LFLCGVTLTSFSDKDPLGIEICSNIQCDIVIQVFKKKYCEFCWSSVVNWLSTMHGMNNIKIAGHVANKKYDQFLGVSSDKIQFSSVER